jgi:hypothetical protein
MNANFVVVDRGSYERLQGERSFYKFMLFLMVPLLLFAMYGFLGAAADRERMIKQEVNSTYSLPLDNKRGN